MTHASEEWRSRPIRSRPSKMMTAAEIITTVATPASVAADIVRAMDGGKAVIYTPWFWRPLMWIVRSVPEAMFRRLRL